MPMVGLRLAQSAKLRDHSLELGGPYGVLGMKAGSATGKVNERLTICTTALAPACLFLI